ncbi:MAG: sulfatase-like hydrolase/transferase [Bacteroidales bacterium]|nr:sulfatase-like hydrolase/transferase [Bacteroidales bacterium]
MRNTLKYIGNVIWNIFLVYICYILCRVIFTLDNWDSFNYLTISDFLRLCRGGLLFDTAAIAYSNILYVLMVFFPLHLKECNGYRKAVKCIFVAVNMLMLAMNLVDSGYFPFSNQRTTTTIFTQFANEDNLAGILFIEALRSWYLIVAFVVMAFVLWRFYRAPQYEKGGRVGYYFISIVALALFGFASFVGIRGGVGKAIRPITLSNANHFTKRPAEASIVLNSPFSFIRTIGNEHFIVPSYFDDREHMQSMYNPLHTPDGTEDFTPMNVVQIILESNSMEYYGRGFTPFLDSLMTESLTYVHSFANGRISIDAMASVLSSIPRIGESFILTPSALNPLSSAAGELGRNKGYHTAFFHGAQENSMGFKAYSQSVGYQEYYGRESYGNDADFDGHWSIWDEEFLQFYAQKMNTFPQPFATAVFTATSHHPYVIPERYNDVFVEGALPIHKCVEYLDMSVRRFFETAAAMPWFENTLFVICADHTNIVELPEYGTEAGRYMVPIMFYKPDGSLKARKDGTMQQIDIMPTILGLLDYDLPYVAFGNDLTSTDPDQSFAVGCNNGVFQLFKDGYLLQFDGEHVVGLYDYVTDKMLQDNLIGKTECIENLELLKSVIQQYMERMTAKDALRAY